MAIFKILAMNMAHLNDRLETLNKRARKLKCDEIVTKVLGYSKDVYNMHGVIIQHAFYEVDVVGFSPKIPGWSFMGTIEHTEHGNILRSVPDQEIPEDYRNAPKRCDHCDKIRNRKDTYIVKKDTGEIKQVGHNCVRDYLGHISPEQLAFAAEWAKSMRALCEMDYDGGGYVPPMVEINRFLSVCAELVIREGFKKSSGGEQGTARMAFDNILLTYEYIKQGKGHLVIKPSPAAIELAEKSKEWGMTLSGKSQYENNLGISLKKELVAPRDAGLVGSAIQAYKKFIGDVEKRVKEIRLYSEYFGEPKKRYDLELKLTKKLAFDSMQGGTFFILLFTDAKGNVFKWNTGTGHGFDLIEGKMYKIRGTVKKHEIYRDIKQTQLTRCSVEKIEDKAA